MERRRGRRRLGAVHADHERGGRHQPGSGGQGGAIAMPTALIILHAEAPGPASIRKPSAAQPKMGSSAMYRMLSQWMKPDRNVIALPAE